MQQKTKEIRKKTERSRMAKINAGHTTEKSRLNLFFRFHKPGQSSLIKTTVQNLGHISLE